MTMNVELEGMQKEVVLAYFNYYHSIHLTGLRKMKKSQLRHPVSE